MKRDRRVELLEKNCSRGTQDGVVRGNVRMQLKPEKVAMFVLLRDDRAGTGMVAGFFVCVEGMQKRFRRYGVDEHQQPKQSEAFAQTHRRKSNR